MDAVGGLGGRRPPDGDCNHFPDADEIANWAGEPACAECNANGVPDECDIASGTSQDVNGDGIPDECGGLTCGNGLIEVGETCDDGNTSNNDGCSSVCGIENGWQCSGEPSVCTDIDECTRGTDNCAANAHVTNTPCGVDCAGNSGYTVDGVPSTGVL